MLSAVLTLRLDLPHTSPGYDSCVYTDFSLIQPRLPRARAIYLFVVPERADGEAAAAAAAAA